MELNNIICLTMNKIISIVIAFIAVAACTGYELDRSFPVDNDASEIIFAGFEENGTTRIQLQEMKTVWTKADLVSVFYRSDANEKWQYTGETGERVGTLSRMTSVQKQNDISKVVVVYPYNERYYINPETCDVEVFLSEVQNYLPESYGLNGNIMISSGYYNQFSLKSICGWLKLQLTGEGTVIKSLTLKGNDGEQVAGQLYVDSNDATATLAAEMGGLDDGENEVGGNLVFDDTIFTEVTLDCGAEGVKLGTTPTAFYIALPPQSFSKGITVEIVDGDGQKMTKSTSNEIIIDRNVIQPMSAFEFEKSVVQNNTEIWYTSAAKLPFTYRTSYGAALVSHEWDPETGKGVITFDSSVTAIPSNAFNFNSATSSTLVSISFPDSVTSIGDWAIASHPNLVSVNLGKGLKTVGNVPFYNCPSLKEFKGACATDDGRAVIANGKIYAFAPAGINAYEIPEGVTAIGNQVFRGCSGLVNVTIPSGVRSIGEFAFYECTSLKEIYIPDTVTSIASYAFEYCSGLDRTIIGKGMTSIGEYVFRNCSGKLIINRNVGAKWFQYSGFTEVIVAEGVTIIGNNAFQLCDVVKVTLPESITTIGSEAFFGCPLGKVNLSDRITSIGNYAFSGCRLTTLKIPASLKTISTGAFQYNPISNVDFNGVASIGDSAFCGCEFYSLVIPTTVTTIGPNAFSENKYLSNVTIPDSVTSIGEYAFMNCTNLSVVRCKRSVPPTLGSGVFHASVPSEGSMKPMSFSLYVPSSSLSKYRNASNWSAYYSCFIGE